MTDIPLARQSCQPRKGEADRVPTSEIAALLASLPGWALDAEGAGLHKDFAFANFHHTLGFINAVGWMANQQNHHPDIEAGYGHCRLYWSTHDVGGLSLNDFICAAKCEELAGQD